MPIQGYDTGKYWKEKYDDLLKLAAKMKRGKLTVLIRRFQLVGRVSYRKAEEYVMAAIDNGDIIAIFGVSIDADRAAEALKAGQTVLFESSTKTSTQAGKTESRFDVNNCSWTEMPKEEDENATQYIEQKQAEKLRKAINHKIGGN